MNVRLLALLFALALPVAAQTAAPAPTSAADMNLLLAQLEQVANATNLDLARLRVEKWKTNGDHKRQLQANVDSLSRNISAALPGMIAQVRSTPSSLAAGFKLYRNVDALYDVLGALTDAAGLFAPKKEEYEALANDLANLDIIRRALADRVEAMAGRQELELARLRGGGSGTKTGSGVKKIVVDDTAPRTRKKKKTASEPE